jgi:hypothetical protein
MRRKVVLSMGAVLLLFLVVTIALPKAADQVGLTVHEWGTFTSVAGVNGDAVAWRTYGGPGDLPCFVNRFGGFKGVLLGNVRMETPVLYFYVYGPRDLTTNVKVRFPMGTLTEWYPKATMSRSYNAIEWHDVKISPDVVMEFPVESGLSHYYAARETDAAPLQIGTQKEKFLFYRGVGTFPLPIAARVRDDGKIVVNSIGEDPVSGVILFENRGGTPRYQLSGMLQNETILDSESLQSNWAGLLMDLERILVDHGLYQKEARAMIETWRDSWFEEGTRLFYIVPKRALDSILPLEVQPVPSQIGRVFVGRMEIITPEIQDRVRQAVARNDRVTLEKYGRFLEPIAKRVGLKSPLLDSIYSNAAAQTATCGG